MKDHASISHFSKRGQLVHDAMLAGFREVIAEVGVMALGSVDGEELVAISKHVAEDLVALVGNAEESARKELLNKNKK